MTENGRTAVLNPQRAVVQRSGSGALRIGLSSSRNGCGELVR